MFVTTWLGHEVLCAVVPVALLPQPDLPIEHPDCMVPTIPWASRVARQVRPRRQLLQCCSYHGADWHTAARAAIRVIRQVSGTALAGEDLEEQIEDLLAEADLPPTEREAASSLAQPALGITLGRLAGSGRIVYTDGRHRARALMDAGVRRTVVMLTDWRPPW